MNTINDKINTIINRITDAAYTGNGEFLKYEGTYDSLRGLIYYRLNKMSKEGRQKFQIGVVNMPNCETVWFIYDRQKVWRKAAEDTDETVQNEAETAETLC